MFSVIHLDFIFYRLLDIDNWYLDRKFDVVSCLNLIDRCDTPLRLINQIRDTLKPDGKVLLAVVLPFSAYVESGKLFCLQGLFIKLTNILNYAATWRAVGSTAFVITSWVIRYFWIVDIWISFPFSFSCVLEVPL